MNEEKSLLQAINQKVLLTPYDTGWLAKFEEETRRIKLLIPGKYVAIEHIGSTAVPNLSAKPIIDILAGVESMSVADVILKKLCKSGYTTSAEFNAIIGNRRWLMRWSNGRRTHHLRLVIYGGVDWDHRLLFRDLLRAITSLSYEYEQHKRALALLHENDREAYTEAKGSFINQVIENHAE